MYLPSKVWSRLGSVRRQLTSALSRNRQQRLMRAAAATVEMLEQRTLLSLSVTGTLSGSSITEGSTVTLTVTAIPSPGSTIDQSFTVDWADGSPQQTFSTDWVTDQYNSNQLDATVFPTHTYTEPSSGRFGDQMAVWTNETNSDGSTDTSCSFFSETVSEATPTVNVGGSGVATQGSTYTINPGFNDPGGDPVTQWQFTWGDGHSEVDGPGGSYSHVFSTAGSFSVTAIATSEDGQFQATQPVNVSGPAPSAPTNFLASVSGSQVNTSWTASASGTVTAYHVARSTHGTSYTDVGTTGPQTTSFTDTTAAPNGTYWYLVYGANGSSYSPYSNAKQVTLPPAMPSNLAVTPTATSLSVSWLPSSGASSYTVWRQGPGDSGYLQVSNQSATSFTDPNVLPNTSYSYEVTATGSTGTSPAAGPQSGTTPNVAPTAPSTLDAVGVSTSQINVTWTDTSNNESGFKVERLPDGGSTWVLLVTTAANVTTYSDTGLSDGTGYTYRVVATNAAGDSASSSTCHAYTKLLGPAGLTGTFVSGGEIDLTWTNQSSNTLETIIDEYVAGVWTPIKTVYGTDDTFAAPGPFGPSSSYNFEVMAYGNAGYSAVSNMATVATPAFPNGPSNPSATAVSSSQINLTWTDNSTDETGFVIQRSPDGYSSWTTLTTTAANVTSYNDMGLTDGRNYYYRIAATNALGMSAFTGNSVYAMTPYITPTIVNVASATQTTVTGTTDTLTVLGSIPGGQESELTYDWTVTSGPSATFSPNYSNAAKNTTVTFSSAGSYALQVTVQNGTQSVTSSVSVTVEQTFTSIAMTPNDASVLPEGTEQFAATANDQFGTAMQSQPQIAWSVADSTLGSIDPSGQFTASDKEGTTTVQAVGGSITGAVPISVSGAETMNFDNLPAGTVVTSQYSGVTFSGDPSYPNEIVPSTDRSQPNSIGAPSTGGNPYNHPLYADFATPVNDLKFYQMRDDASAGTLIAQVNVYQGGHMTVAVNVLSDGATNVPGLVDLSAYQDVTRIEIVNVTDPAGLIYDDFSFQPVIAHITGFRSGDNFGQAVSDTVKKGNDPSQYVVLVNDNYDQNLSGGMPDDSAGTAPVQNDQMRLDSNGNPLDADFGHFQLNLFPTDLTSGTVTLRASKRTY